MPFLDSIGYPEKKNMEEKRSSLKLHPRFNNYPFWKDELRQNCYKRVRQDRSRLLWKLRLPHTQPPPLPINHQELINTAFQDIISDELKKLKDLSSSSSSSSTPAATRTDDFLWEYNGLQHAFQCDCEEMLLEMQRIFYEDLVSESPIDAWEDQEDEYLANAVFQHMQLNDDQQVKQVWCPICKEAALLENERLIFCTLCKLELNKENEVNLEFLRDRLAEAHEDHFERGCKVKPDLSLQSEFGLTALYICCQACNTFEVVV